jgi:hypothetical protein
VWAKTGSWNEMYKYGLPYNVEARTVVESPEEGMQLRTQNGDLCNLTFKDQGEWAYSSRKTMKE